MCMHPQKDFVERRRRLRNILEGTHDEAWKAPTALIFLFLLLGLHHYFSQFFEVLWLLDGALESIFFPRSL